MGVSIVIVMIAAVAGCALKANAMLRWGANETMISSGGIDSANALISSARAGRIFLVPEPVRRDAALPWLS
ncbi:hypothetical protein [Polaromonas sp. JS666]|uniref:hypothetical protein n=1 Tax=Polaromonas sp. (strain JS666 / ATCC BAA-500) TaxID=296591 RepID=UPI000307BD18|nr:hypothetical protein [Polaromonas sp. JS666]